MRQAYRVRSRIGAVLSRALPRRTLHRVFFIVSVFLIVVALVGVASRFYAAGSSVTLGMVAAAPYVMSTSVIALVLTLISRQWLYSLVAIAVLAVCATTQTHLYVASTAPEDAVSVSVMTANLRLGEASAQSLIHAVQRHKVDILMAEELTSAEADRLNAAGLSALLPYRAVRPGEGAVGTGLWSRYPLTDVRYPTQLTFAMVTARVEVPGLRLRPTAVALHVPGPVPNATAWKTDISRLPSLLDRLPTDAPVVVGGDFNATNDMPQFRQLLSHGYRDAADQAGAGYTRSYPSNRWFPPLIAIDHVVTRGAVATAVSTVQISGSDHRALATRIALPRG